MTAHERSVVLRRLDDERYDARPLRWIAAPIERALLDQARTLAFSSGRVLERDGASVLSWGAVATVELPGGLGDPAVPGAALACLAGLVADDRQSTRHAPGGPIALGALAFDRGARGRLVVPAMTIVADGGDPPITIAVGTSDDLARARDAFPFEANLPAPRAPSRTPPPDSFELVSLASHDEFCTRIDDALEAIRSGAFCKVVLAREVAIHANRPFSQGDLLERVRRLHPACMAFAIDGFLGASPELLCRRRGAHAVSRPLAGTVARSGDPDEDARLATALLASPKERAEHRYVVEAIAATFAQFSDHVEAGDQPHLLALRNVAHLATEIRATLDPTASGALPNVLALVSALHPTPAVGGYPRDAALEYLDKHEDLDRDRYAGPVGWVRADGDGEWWLGIRSAILDGRSARLFAGVGIVEGSDPRTELVETQLKLQAILAAAVRP